MKQYPTITLSPDSALALYDLITAIKNTLDIDQSEAIQRLFDGTGLAIVAAFAKRYK